MAANQYRKKQLKEKILFNLPVPLPCLNRNADESNGVIAAACAQQQSLVQEMLSKQLNRVLWTKIRLREFWRTCKLHWVDQDYINNIRVDKGTFVFMEERLTPYLQRRSTRMRQCINVDERVAMAFWRYASGDSVRTIAWMFGVGESTCSAICLEVAESICAEFAPEFLATPSHEEDPHQAELFEEDEEYPCVYVLGMDPISQYLGHMGTENFFGASKDFVP